MKVAPRTIRTYKLPDGGAPFEKWHSNLKVKKVRFAILARIDRLRSGNFGNYRSLAEDLYELKIRWRPGYRVYFGELEDSIILLWGGTKKTQSNDINKAKSFWEEFRSRLP